MTEPFDFEAFIAGSKLAEDTFDLYLVNHGPAIARLQAEIEQATTAGGDDRESTIPADVTALEQEAARLAAEMQKSRKEVTLRQLTYDELADTAEPQSTLYDQLALQSSDIGDWKSPNPMTPEQWKRLADAAGAGQFNEFLGKANALATAKVVVPDFSPSTSTTQDLRESSLS